MHAVSISFAACFALTPAPLLGLSFSPSFYFFFQSNRHRVHVSLVFDDICPSITRLPPHQPLSQWQDHSCFQNRGVI